MGITAVSILAVDVPSRIGAQPSGHGTLDKPVTGATILHTDTRAVQRITIRLVWIAGIETGKGRGFALEARVPQEAKT